MNNQGQREMGVSGDTANLLKRYVEEEYNCVTSYKGFTKDAYYFEASGNEFRIKIEKENGYRIQEQEKSEGTWKEIDPITNNDLKKFLEKDVQYAAIDKLSTEKEFRNFLDVQAKFPYYSLENQLLLYKQEREKDVPNITMIQGKSRWEQLGEKIKEGVQALTLRVPVLNKQNDKTIINDSKSVKVYDISQIHEPKLAVPTQLNNEKMYERFKKYVNAIAPTRLDEQAKFTDSLSQYIEIQSKQSVKPYRPYPEEHHKAIEQAVAYVVLKHYNPPLENMKLDQVVAIAAADLDIKKSIFKEAHHISQKTIDLCNRITHELKLEKNTDLFKEKRNEKIQDRERSLER